MAINRIFSGKRQPMVRRVVPMNVKQGNYYQDLIKAVEPDSVFIKEFEKLFSIKPPAEQGELVGVISSNIDQSKVLSKISTLINSDTLRGSAIKQANQALSEITDLKNSFGLSLIEAVEETCEISTFGLIEVLDSLSKKESISENEIRLILLSLSRLKPFFQASQDLGRKIHQELESALALDKEEKLLLGPGDDERRYWSELYVAFYSRPWLYFIDGIRENPSKWFYQELNENNYNEIDTHHEPSNDQRILIDQLYSSNLQLNFFKTPFVLWGYKEGAKGSLGDLGKIFDITPTSIKRIVK